MPRKYWAGVSALPCFLPLFFLGRDRRVCLSVRLFVSLTDFRALLFIFNSSWRQSLQFIGKSCSMQDPPKRGWLDERVVSRTEILPLYLTSRDIITHCFWQPKSKLQYWSQRKSLLLLGQAVSSRRGRRAHKSITVMNIDGVWFRAETNNKEKLN